MMATGRNYGERVGAGSRGCAYISHEDDWLKSISPRLDIADLEALLADNLVIGL